MPNLAPHQASPFAPSAVWDGSRYWITFLSDSGDGAIYFATSADGVNLTAVNTVNGQFASAPPAIALRHGVPVIVYAQVGGDAPFIIWTEWSAQAGTWTGGQRVPSNDSASALTAITQPNGSVLVLFREATTDTLDSTTIP